MASAEENEYNIPAAYENLDEFAAPSPEENPHEYTSYRSQSLEESRNRAGSFQASHEKRRDFLERHQTAESQRVRRQSEGYAADLTELSAPPHAERDTTGSFSGVHKVQDTRGKLQSISNQEPLSAFMTKLYTISYLIFFSILGTLARLGVKAITAYPGAPVGTAVLWSNFGGSLFMGFLSEDRMLFGEEWGFPSKTDPSTKSKRTDEEGNTFGAISRETDIDSVAERKRHISVKKTIPLYIGLATGFCGSFTSFSSFILDAFLALSNSFAVPVSQIVPASLNSTSSSTVPRNGGYSFMALLAIVISTIALCVGALQAGAHLAIGLEAYTPRVPFRVMRRMIDPIFLVIAFGAWLGAIMMAIWPPDRAGGPQEHAIAAQETWRGEAIFALVFAPLGCLLRFYTSIYLNGKIASFPLGTFVVNVAGCLVLAIAYDLQHAPLDGSTRGYIGGGQVGCQVLQGVMDGFCGCLTTVSTWVLELKGLMRKHSYIYAGLSVLVALGLMIVVLGSLKWTLGFSPPACVT